MHQRSVLRFILGVSGILFVSACGTTTTPTLVVKGATSAARFAMPNAAEFFGFRPTTAGSPTVFNLKLYAAYLTTSAACTAPFVEVANNGTTGTSYDMVAAPTILSASPAAGTYNCFILRMSDTMTFRPDATATAAFPTSCPTGVDATFDIYRAGETPLWKDKDGNDIAATGTESAPAESSTVVSGATVPGVTIFASTTPASVTAGGVSTNQVLTLAAAVTVTAATTNLTLVTDFHDKVSENSSHCWMEAGTMAIH